MRGNEGEKAERIKKNQKQTSAETEYLSLKDAAIAAIFLVLFALANLSERVDLLFVTRKAKNVKEGGIGLIHPIHPFYFISPSSVTRNCQNGITLPTLDPVIHAVFDRLTKYGGHGMVDRVMECK